MVYIVGLTDEESALRDKKSRLINITEEFLGTTGKHRILKSNIDSGFCLNHHSSESGNHPVIISVENNRIHVKSGAYFEEAKSLAEAYEEATGEDFTIKKTYE